MNSLTKWMLAVVVVAAIPFAAHGRSSYLTTFNSMYGTANTKLDSCSTCHASSTSTWNPYGTDVRARISTGISAALTAVEPLDSDADKFTNIDEINALTLPGDKTDFPAAAPPPCPDADGDGYAVCDGTCTLPAGKQCGDCNDANAAVNPGVTEICTNGIDDNCDGAIDAKDPFCASPALSDYDISALRVSGRTVVGRKVSVKVVVTEVVPGAASLTVQYTQGGVSGTLGTVSQLQAGTYAFSYVPTVSGPITWTATIVDQDPDVDTATATTTVK